MKLAKAMEIINRQTKSDGGFRVSFEWRDGGILISDHFPERDEIPFATEKHAWEVARMFAAKEPRAVNIYVIYAVDWTPVPDYGTRVLNRYPDSVTT